MNPHACAWIAQNINKPRPHRIKKVSLFPQDLQNQTVKSDGCRVTKRWVIRKQSQQHEVEGGGGDKITSWEVEEVLYTRASGMVKSRSKQNHRVKDLASPPGSVSLQLAWQFTSGDCMRIIKSVTQFPLWFSYWLLIQAQFAVNYLKWIFNLKWVRHA